MQVGDYVRTDKGLIAKYIGINKEYELHLFDGDIQWFYEYYRQEIDFEDWKEFIEEDVVKSSPNIIDLIKVGDYVNGSKVIDISIIGKDKEKWVWVEQTEDTDNEYGDDYVGYNNDQIKSIVTKEQFESMEYRIEE